MVIRGAQATGNASDGLSLYYAPSQLAAYAVGGFAFAALGAFAVWIVLQDANSLWSWVAAVLPFFGVVFFGSIGILATVRMLNRRVVVHIGDDGVYDARISERVIPWPAIDAISVRHMDLQRFIMIELDPTFESQLQMTRSASLFMPLNARIGYPGLCLNLAGLDHAHDDVVAAIQHFDSRASNP